MTISNFPSQFRINLEEDERVNLFSLYDQDPSVHDEGTLLHKALRMGIQQLYRDSLKNGPPRRTRSELDAGIESRAQSRGQKGVLHDDAEAPTPHRHVEQYLGVFVGERLRQRLEDFLSAHDDIDEETAYALLLDLGLTKAVDEPEAVDPKAVLTDLNSELTRAASDARKRRLNRLAQIRALHLQCR